jgi:hypothetical protein
MTCRAESSDLGKVFGEDVARYDMHYYHGGYFHGFG